ncbi:MAG: hypothetical protein IJA95_07550 [Bacteroidaceae bacterium]|nr:hypothetical protein [Bacteroidaceae bacterium]
MTARIFIKENGCLRVEGNVVTNRDAVLEDLMDVKFCCGTACSEILPTVFVDKSAFRHFKGAEITGDLILEKI